MRRPVIAAILLALATDALAGAPPPAFPLKPSANNRFLVDRNDVPFLMIGDAPQRWSATCRSGKPSSSSRTAQSTASTRCG